MYIENKVSDSESKQYHFPDIYFQDITEIHNNKEFSVKRKYTGLYTVFINIIEEKTQNCRISFSGVFPRMTYICKNHDFSDTEIYHLNKFRIHCNRIRQNQDIPSYED